MDASGTLEAIRAAVGTLPQEPVSVRFLHAAAGPVTQADIDLAAAAEDVLRSGTVHATVKKQGPS